MEARDATARKAIDTLAGILDANSLTTAWESALNAPLWDGHAVWTHGDLLPPNLLVSRNRLSAVFDFGNMGIGDPAVDVVVAWSVLDRKGRELFRSALRLDDAIWARARGFALYQALLIIPYYRDTNPAFVRMATRTVAEVLSDFE